MPARCRENRSRTEVLGLTRSHSDDLVHAVSPYMMRKSSSAMSFPADTPAAVLILSERPNRPLVWMAPFCLRSSITIQTVVAPRSYSNPPAATIKPSVAERSEELCFGTPETAVPVRWGEASAIAMRSIQVARKHRPREYWLWTVSRSTSLTVRVLLIPTSHNRRLGFATLHKLDATHLELCSNTRTNCSCRKWVGQCR